MTTKKIGNLLLDDVNMTAERTVKPQDRDGTIADLQNLQDAAADKPSYYFNGAATTYISCGVNDNFSFTNAAGDLPFSVMVRGNLAANPKAAEIDLLAKMDQASTFEWAFSQSTTNKVFFKMLGSTGSTSIIATSDTAMTLGKNTAWLGTYNGSKLETGIKLYENGVLLPATKVFSAYPGMTKNATPLIIGKRLNYDTTIKGQLSQTLIFNYDISAYPDKIARYSAGAKLDWEDVGGSMTSRTAAGAFTNDGLTSFTSSNNTQFTGTVDSANDGAFAPVMTAAMEVGKQYGITFTSTEARTIEIVFYDVSYNVTQIVTAVYTAGQTKTTSFTHAPIYGVAVGSYKIRSSSNGVMTITNVLLNQLGCVLGLEPEGITSTKWLDQSGNGLDGTVTGAVATNIPNQWKAYTSVLSNGGVGATQSFIYRIINNSLQVKGTIVLGTVTTGTITWKIPTGLTASFTNYGLGLVGTNAFQIVGSAIGYKADNSKSCNGYVLRSNTSNTEFQAVTQNTFNVPTDLAWGLSSCTLAAGDTISIDMIIPL
jgi:hypothetical protein